MTTALNPIAPHHLAIERDRLDQWAHSHQHNRQASRAESDMSTTAMECMDDLEGLFCEALSQDANDGTFRGIAQLTVTKWLSARAKAYGI
jgi:hypothetical protein